MSDDCIARSQRGNRYFGCPVLVNFPGLSRLATMEITVMSNPILKLFSSSRYPAPYSMFHDQPSKTNSLVGPLGFVNHLNRGDPKPQGEIRIFVLGNSAVRSPPTPELSMCGHLERSLSGSGVGTPKVYNFGIESGNARQGLMLLLDLLVELKPDIVIAYDGVTDLIVPQFYDPRPGYPYNHYLLEILHEHIGGNRLLDLDLLRMEGARREELRKEYGFGSEAYKNALVSSYAETIRRYCIVCQAFGIRFLHVFQAALARKANYAGTEVPYKAIAESIANMFGAAVAKRSEVEAQFPNRDWVRFGDAITLFEGRTDECFSDWTHLHDHAQSVPAAYLASLLRGWA